MKKPVCVLFAALLLTPALAIAQAIEQASGSGSGSSAGSGSGAGAGQRDARGGTAATPAVAAKIEDAQSTRFVRTLTNVQIELTVTDQLGTTPPEKKVVSMIVSSGNWGKIRSVGSVPQIGDPPYVVDLNVDARPFVSTEGPIQLELTLNYYPPKGAADSRDPKPRPTGINQSQTVVLTSGKPLIISQAADPLSDRKVTVEVKATVLK